jgi:hypothetical protein
VRQDLILDGRVIAIRTIHPDGGRAVHLQVLAFANAGVPYRLGNATAGKCSNLDVSMHWGAETSRLKLPTASSLRIAAKVSVVHTLQSPVQLWSRPSELMESNTPHVAAANSPAVS